MHYERALWWNQNVFLVFGEPMKNFVCDICCDILIATANLMSARNNVIDKYCACSFRKNTD